MVALSAVVSTGQSEYHHISSSRKSRITNIVTQSCLFLYTCWSHWSTNSSLVPAPYIPDTSLEMYQKKLLVWVWIPNRSIYDVAKWLKEEKRSTESSDRTGRNTPTECWLMDAMYSWGECQTIITVCTMDRLCLSLILSHGSCSNGLQR